MIRPPIICARGRGQARRDVDIPVLAVEQHGTAAGRLHRIDQVQQLGASGLGDLAQGLAVGVVADAADEAGHLGRLQRPLLAPTQPRRESRRRRVRRQRLTRARAVLADMPGKRGSSSGKRRRPRTARRCAGRSRRSCARAVGASQRKSIRTVSHAREDVRWRVWKGGRRSKVYMGRCCGDARMASSALRPNLRVCVCSP